MKIPIATALVVLLAASPAAAQFGGITQGLRKAKEVKDRVDDVVFTDAEEQQLGAKVSGLLREKYGVAQDKAVHRYVTLTGTVLAQASSRPNLSWTFIVLDTDGVNAFAAPGGFIHVTRGALALMQSEAELAGVLGHEIGHVTAKHTIRAVQKNKLVQAGASMARSAVLEEFANRAYEMLLENAYDRGDEMDADKTGIGLANGVGYAPAGLSAFLTRLAERNKALTDRSGLFASHPETKARLDASAKLIASQKLAASATVAARFDQSINYQPVSVTQVAAGASGASGLTEAKPAEKKAEEKKPAASKFGLTGLNPLGREKSSSQTVASAGSRGVNPDRDAKGGSNSTPVAVTVSAADVAEFRKGIV